MLPHLFAEDTCGVRQYKVLSLTPLALRDLKDDRVVTPKPVGSVAYRLFWRLPRHLRTLLDP